MSNVLIKLFYLLKKVDFSDYYFLRYNLRRKICISINVGSNLLIYLVFWCQKFEDESCLLLSFKRCFFSDDLAWFLMIWLL